MNCLSQLFLGDIPVCTNHDFRNPSKRLRIVISLQKSALHRSTPFHQQNSRCGQRKPYADNALRMQWALALLVREAAGGAVRALPGLPLPARRHAAATEAPAATAVAAAAKATAVAIVAAAVAAL